MLGLFPDPYPDELLYSVCGRYQDRVQFRQMTTVRELFGKITKPVVAFPCHLASLIEVLPTGHRYTVDRLIDELTLLPFYSPFLPTQRVKIIRESMRSQERPVISSRLAVLNQIRSPAQLQFCLECVKADREKFGECYWHRLHQLPGVKICPFHTVYLQQSQIHVLRHLPIYEFVSAEQALHEIEMTSSINNPLPNHPIWTQIALDAAWLLAQPNLISDIRFISIRYKKLLARIELANTNGTIYTEKLVEVFQKTYPVDCLKLLQCLIDWKERPIWILRVLGYWRSPQHPAAPFTINSLASMFSQRIFSTSVELYCHDLRPIRADTS